MPIPYMSHDAIVSLFAFLNDVATNPEAIDIGGTNGETAWVSMAEFDNVYGYVQLGTWNATDDLDICKFEQAQDSAGTGKKDLTTAGAGATFGYNTTAGQTPNAAGETVHLDARQEDLDVANGFTHVRLFVSEAGNTGPDFVLGGLVRYGARNARKQLAGAATAGVRQYVKPS